MNSSRFIDDMPYYYIISTLYENFKIVLGTLVLSFWGIDGKRFFCKATPA